jgi:hypothetical protein
MPDFHGHPTGVLMNDHLRLEYLTQAGPRIVRLCLSGRDENLLSEQPSAGWDTPQGRFQLFGGHRLWAAPEGPGVSYLPDSSGLQVRPSGPGVELVYDPGPGRGLAVSLGIRLLDDRAGLRLVHGLTNRFEHTIRAGVWGITALPLGGRAFLPCPPTGAGFLPDRHLVLWPYSHWDDPRLGLARAGLEIRAEAGLPPLKVGTLVPGGRCAYLRDGVLLVKLLEPAAGEYPDRGCNAEVYCAEDFIELETLTPLSDLPPGGSITATELWEIHTGPHAERALNIIFAVGDAS